MNTKFLLLIFGIATSFGCDSDAVNPQLDRIEYGTSFGFCVGYCTQVLEVSPTQINKRLIPQVNEDLPQKNCTDSFASFESLLEKIDLEAFSELDETIGCPDCADGGAEWIEITTRDANKRVVFY